MTRTERLFCAECGGRPYRILLDTERDELVLTCDEHGDIAVADIRYADLEVLG